MRKTVRGFDWERGSYTRKVLTRSFQTFEAAEKFAECKDVRDIYRNKGKYVVEWFKTIYENERGIENEQATKDSN